MMTSKKQNKKFIFLDYSEAIQFIIKLKIKNRREWYMYIRNQFPNLPHLPANIPKSPQHVYKNKGWINWGEWLGTKTISVRFRKYRDFSEARKFVCQLKLNSVKEWNLYCKGHYPDKPKIPNDIPNDAYRIYKNKGWINWAHWMGYDTY